MKRNVQSDGRLRSRSNPSVSARNGGEPRLDCIGVHVHCLALKGVDLTSASGKLHMTVLAAVAQFERDLLIERTHVGLARAKAEGKKLGRRDSLTDEQKAEIRAKLAEGSTARGLTKDYGVSHPTILKLAQAGA